MAILRNVAKTDTLEDQRQEINLIGQDLFSVLSGTANISANLLAIQDGTKTNPSLSFATESNLGFYKPSERTLSFVSNNLTIADYSSSEVSFKKNLKVDKTSLNNDDVSISSPGSEYSVGSYQNVLLYGGSGFGAEADIEVTEYIGDYTNNNYINRYSDGNYTNIVLAGGSGTGSVANFTISSLNVADLFLIQNAGSGYVPSTYNNVPLLNGSGSGKRANLTIQGTVSLSGSITNPGSGYTNNTYQNVDLLSVPTATYPLVVSSGEQVEFKYGNRYEWNVVDNGLNTAYTFSGQTSGDNVFIQVEQGDLLVFNVNAPGHPFWISLTDAYDPNTVLPDGVTNNGTDNGTIILDTNLIQSDATYYYVCQFHGAMAGQILVSPYSGGTFAIGDTITTGTVSGTSTFVNNEDDVKFVRFSNVSGGSFAQGDSVNNGSGVNALIYSNQQTVDFYTSSGNDLSSLSLEPSNTYRFDLSDSSNTSIAPIITDSFDTSPDIDSFYSIQKGTPGQTNSFIDLTISPNTIESFARITPQGSTTGQSFLIVSPFVNPSSNYLIQAKATVEVDISGQVSNLSITSNGINYEDNYTTVVEVYSGDVGGSGSGFEYSITDVVFTGTVTEVEITVEGSGYAENDVLNVDTLNVGGQGSGFELLLFNTKSISELDFVSKGTGYQNGDILTLPEKVSNISATLDSNSTNITVSSTTGIYEGFSVVLISGTGSLQAGTTVSQIIDSTTLTLSQTPLVSGSAVLDFDPPYGVNTGFEWQISRVGAVDSITITNPGSGYEIDDVLTVDRGDISINPGPYSQTDNFSALVTSVNTTNVLQSNSSSGQLYALSISSPNAQFTNSSIDSLSSPDIVGDVISLSEINSSGNININTPNEINIAATRVDVGPNIQAILSSGNITTSGIITTGILNTGGILTIDTDISAVSGSDVVISPPTNRVARISSTTALIIPSGNTAARPQAGVVADGAIRYNNETTQYEGYSSSTGQWSSLGGIRDLDGNTYILAEEFVGANDNTLYFYNDNQNTLRLTPFEMEFRSVKTISSTNLSAPTYDQWNPNTPVNSGEYLRYLNNIYVVATAGTTGDVTSPPTHENGTATDGTAELTWNSVAVDELVFDGISQIKLGPNKNTPVRISEEIQIFNDEISSLNLDLKLAPFTGKKVVVDTNTSLQLPFGTTNDRGIPGTGSVRFNTQLTQFEGYNGANWTSLGGVRDVDGNTYIIPETGPGNNENILYFYNDNNNTLQLSTTALTFKTVNTIESDSSNLDINAATIGFNNDILTLTTGATETKFATTSNNLEFAVSSGIYNDVVFRATNNGDLQLNTGFGTGTPSYTTLISNDLTSFELRDSNITSQEVSLVKGTTDFGLITVFDPSVHKGAKIALVADNVNTNDREMIEFSVIAKGTDIFHTEYGNINTGSGLVEVTFDFDGSNNVRITPTLLSSVTAGNTVNVTAVITIIKK